MKLESAMKLEKDNYTDSVGDQYSILRRRSIDQARHRPSKRWAITCNDIETWLYNTRAAAERGLAELIADDSEQ